MKDLVSSHNAMEFSQTPISPQNNSAVLCIGDLKDSDVDDDDSSEGLFTFKDEALNINKLQTVNEPQNFHNPAPFSFQFTSFHPQIKWFQRGELVTIYIKLINPAMQKCEFHSDTAIYSGYVYDRHYYAKLELSGNIIAEESSWEMRCNEPVMKLKKKEKQDWRSLLKHKSPFVSYEFDFIEETRVSSVNG
ncbi:putative ATP-dependent RNA helicase TDRD12 [Sinocyclocheilus grahami]|nr:PREDICTED: putative ATP-dependent RNA helicase TDRD12 [Sinocyclocheilus grahami]